MGPVKNPLALAGTLNLSNKTALRLAENLDDWLHFKATSYQLEQKHPFGVVKAGLHRTSKVRILFRDRVTHEASSEDVLCLFYQIIIVRRYDICSGGLWYAETSFHRVQEFYTDRNIEIQLYGAEEFVVTRLLPALNFRIFANKVESNPVNLGRRPLGFIKEPPPVQSPAIAALYVLARAAIRSHQEGYFIDLCLRFLLPPLCQEAIGLANVDLPSSIVMALSVFSSDCFGDDEVYLFPYRTPPSLLGKIRAGQGISSDHQVCRHTLRSIFEERINLHFLWSGRNNHSPLASNVERDEAHKEALGVLDSDYSHSSFTRSYGPTKDYEASNVLNRELGVFSLESLLFIHETVPRVTDFEYGSELELSRLLLKTWKFLGDNLLRHEHLTGGVSGMVRYCARMYLGVVVGGFERGYDLAVDPFELHSSIWRTEEIYISPQFYVDACASACLVSFFNQAAFYTDHSNESSRFQSVRAYERLLVLLFATRSVVVEESIESVFSSRNHGYFSELTYGPTDLTTQMYQMWVRLTCRFTADERRRFLPTRNQNPLIDLYRMLDQSRP